ncbi:L-rhamnose-binding lectin CSL1 [Stigmatopora nigra]
MAFCVGLWLTIMRLLLLTAGVESAEQVITCDINHQQVHHLHCGQGVIDVTDALYGRSSSEVCIEPQSHETVADTKCTRQGTLDKVKIGCNGKQSCDLFLEDFRKPDPCVGTSKYLLTNFDCMPAITAVACEMSIAHLYCGPGHVIHVYGADYGRRNDNICQYKRHRHGIENKECIGPNDIVANKCNGQNKCDIMASNAVFGDPCPGTYKYLEVAYSCGDKDENQTTYLWYKVAQTGKSSLLGIFQLAFNIFGNMASCVGICSKIVLVATALFLATVVNSVEQMTTCDSDNLNVHRLHCEGGVISVDQALYGRSSSVVCAEGRPPQQVVNTQCAGQGTVDALKTECNGKRTCMVNTNTFRNPDPCVGTFKYLQTNFTCFPAITTIACEESLMHLFCEAGQVISVFGADYGRRDRSTCSYKRPPNQLQNVECLSPTEIVANRCNGKSSCTIRAINSVFGDPCRGTYKYLEVAYACFFN